MSAQDNYKSINLPLLLGCALFLSAIPAAAGPQGGHAAAPEPRCEASADYVPGVDADGNAVVPAEGADAQPAPALGRVLVTIPLHHRARGAVTVPVDLSRDVPACAPPPRNR